MSEFDRTRFEEIMQQGVVAHSQGQHMLALSLRERARDMAPPDSSEQGRAHRDMAASCDRLGMFREANLNADEALRIHNMLVEGAENPDRAAFRERSASHMYIAANGLRWVISALRADAQPAEELLAAVDTHACGAWSDIRSAKGLANRFIDRRFDQYEINQARRVSMAASVTGNRARAISIATKAVGMSPMSESRWLGTSQPEFTREQRYCAKLRALAGGTAALGVGILMTPKPGRRQALALRIADRAL